MSFKFEYFKPVKIQTSRGATISISKTVIAFSVEAIRKFGLPEYIKMGYDSQRKLLAFVAAEETDESKIPFKKKEKQGAVRIAHKNIIRQLQSFLNIDFADNPVKYMTIHENNMLIIDLKEVRS